MKVGDVVATKYGEGTLVKQERPSGITFTRWIVRFDSFDGFEETYRDGLKQIQDKNGGLALFPGDYLTKEANHDC